MNSGHLFPIAAILVSLLLVLGLGRGVGMFLFLPFLGIGLLCELLAFIFGIIGWKTTQGKIAAIGVPCLGIFSVLGGVVLLPLFFMPHCVEVQPQQHFVYHKAYSLDSMDGVLTQDGIELDNVISADGNGSLKTFTNSVDNKVVRKVVRLFETGPIGIENRTLIYSAKVKSELESGRAYLEMWCEFNGKGEFFSRSLAQPILGSTHWATIQTPFRLEPGQVPTNVKLNLVIEGIGTVWIDDIKLLSSPLD